MPSMTGEFKFIKSDNFDAYVTAIGLYVRMREMSIPAAETIRITNQLDDWTIRTSNTVGVVTEVKCFNFRLGQEFEETFDDGRTCKSVITQEGEDKLVYEQKYIDGLTLKVVKEFTDTEMKMTLEGPGNVVAARFYQKQ